MPLPYNTDELLARSKAMLAQTAAEGEKPFAGSSYERGLTSTPSAGGGAPITQSSGGLVGFKETLDEVINLAKQKRNAMSVGFMAGVAPAGTMAASDFNSILSGLNKASDKTAEDITKAVTPTYKTERIPGEGLYQYQVDGSGKIVGEPVKIIDESTTDTPSKNTKSITELKNALVESKFAGPEADSTYADPQLYLDNYNNWLKYDTAESFFKNFPPKTYINPENTWLPEEIMRFVPKPKETETETIENPFKKK